MVTSLFWSMVSTMSLHFCRLCTQMRFWMALFNLGSSDEVGSLLRMSSRLFITSSISAGTASSWSLWRPVGMWCDAALSRMVLLISLAVCWKRTLAQGDLYFLSVSIPVGLF